LLGHQSFHGFVAALDCTEGSGGFSAKGGEGGVLGALGGESTDVWGFIRVKVIAADGG